MNVDCNVYFFFHIVAKINIYKIVVLTVKNRVDLIICYNCCFHFVVRKWSNIVYYYYIIIIKSRLTRLY